MDDQNKHEKKFEELKEKFDDIGITIGGIPEDTSKEDESVLDSAPDQSVILSGNLDGEIFFKLLVYYKDRSNAMQERSEVNLMNEKEDYSGMVVRYRLVGERYYSDTYFIGEESQIEQFVSDIRNRR